MLFDWYFVYLVCYSSSRLFKYVLFSYLFCFPRVRGTKIIRDFFSFLTGGFCSFDNVDLLRFHQITFGFYDLTCFLNFYFDYRLFMYFLIIILQDFLFNRERIASFYSCIAKTTTMYMNTICFEFFLFFFSR